ncbi:TniB family NTP-binding protein [Methylobacterium sp. E-016]|uniref:TniB family NTP-binding protein n=1 Tax=Methylobacterium sp. E-016 TaxID=2836556 RepID=UPI001FBB720B|nr:TniB family NTP-binding protein [Methylobacterium sp. E-016]MCJ2075554.1 TniB family NTP-binding protein [Methylobacterium sp. E-016]
MSTPIGQDGRTELDRALNERDLAVLATMDRVKGKFIFTAVDRELTREISRLIVQPALRADPRKPSAGDNRREGRLLVFTGPSGAGKTSSLTRALARHPFLADHAIDDPRGPVAMITVTSPCTLKQLGRDTLRKLGYPLERDLKEHMTWERVHARIAEEKKRILIFDEMQHITQTINLVEQEKVANTIKNLMINHDWRSSIIVCGLPAVARFIRRDEQLRRRAIFLETKRLQLPYDNADIATMITGLAKVAQLQVAGDIETDLAPRLIHASGYRLGIAVEFTHDAIERALQPDYLDVEDDDDIVLGDRRGDHGDGSLTLQHFARAFERRAGCQDEDNPFVSRDWIGTQAPADPASEPSTASGSHKGGGR